MAALQARALIDSGKATERDFAEVVARNRSNAKSNPFAQVKGDYSVEVCSECHPFYTGTQKSVDNMGGRVEKFRNRFGKTTTIAK